MEQIKYLSSCISTLNTLIEQKQADLTNYKSQAKQSAKAVFFKETEINNLTAILNAWTESLTEIEAEFLTMQKQINESKQAVLKLEGLLLFIDILPYEINRFKQKPLTEIINLLKLNSKYAKPPEPVRIAKSPIIPFALLKEKATTGTCSDKNFKIQLYKKPL